MKYFFLLMLLLPITHGCQKVIDKDDIQREESFDEDEMHENDSFDKSVPVSTDDEVDNN